MNLTLSIDLKSDPTSLFNGTNMMYNLHTSYSLNVKEWNGYLLKEWEV